MGNYGNTADYWYRRAAIILWRKADQDIILNNLGSEFGAEKESDSDFKLKGYLTNHLAQELSKGLRAVDDWSILVKLPCACSRCTIATEFLKSPTEIKRIWPIAMADRDHIIDLFMRLELPVDLSVQKGSRPYKLVMIKNARLFTEAQKRFDRVKTCYEKMVARQHPIIN